MIATIATLCFVCISIFGGLIYMIILAIRREKKMRSHKD